MKVTREIRRLARELFQLSLANGRLDGSRIKEISARLAAEKPRGYVQTLKEFTRLVRLELERRHAVIESAEALASSAVTSLEKTLKARFGADITTEFRTNPSLIAGLRIKLGSDVWDGSVKARLSALEKQL